MPIETCNVCAGTGRIPKGKRFTGLSDRPIEGDGSEPCFYCGGNGKLLIDSTNILGSRATEAEREQARREGIRTG